MMPLITRPPILAKEGSMSDPEGFGSGDRLEAAAARLRSTADEKLGDLWWWFLVRGALAGALGVAALVWPSASLGVLARLAGIYCLLDGVASLVAAVRGADAKATWPTTFAGLAAGAVLLFWPGLPLRGFLVAFGGWALFTGASQVRAARGRDADEEGGATTTLGWLLAGFGLVLMLWPGTGVVAIAWVIALAALAIAGFLLFVAQRLRRLQAHVSRAA
jgi:uncharacterized membrane protein HdeD (DUF308 family)